MQTDVDIQLGEWTMFGLTWDGTSGIVYINGEVALESDIEYDAPGVILLSAANTTGQFAWLSFIHRRRLLKS